VFEKERPAEQGGGKSVDLVMNPRAWYVVRNTRGVTGFVGPGSKPVPLSDEEVTSMGVERIPIMLNIEVGETVRVINGPLENFTGRVEALDIERQKIKLTVSMFGRETPVELDFVQVQRI
jgi:transcriptional antiterminator NusG